jgi:Polysaccharide lyase
MHAGSAGSDLPEQACGDPDRSANCSADNGFNRADYEGWGALNGVNERQQWVTDPTGSGETVAQLEVYGTDTADQYGGTRSSLWRTPDNCNGCEGWVAFGFYLPSDFVYPDSWFLLYQLFSSGGNPAQALELKGAGCAGVAPRNHLCWKDQTAPYSGVHYADLGLVRPGHWHYLVEHVRFSDTSSGFDQVWLGTDSIPDLSRAPLGEFSGNTLYDSSPGRSNILLYRDPGPASQHQVVDYCGFHRAPDWPTARALPNCPIGP